jgi:GT2 family glycosyltransferase
MSQTYDCIASVVVYDTSPQVLQECVNSFLDTKLKVKIYIIDNSPTPGRYILQEDERIFYHFNHGRNVGYGKGNNIAINNAERSKYFLILNPDVFIKDDALEKVIHYMDMNPEIGIGIPKVINLDGSQQFLNKRYPSLFPLFVRRFVPGFLHFLFKSVLENYEMRDLNQDENYEVPFISGAFMLFRRDVLDQVKGFDPRYFLYFEDADICREVHKLGYRTSYFAKANIVHLWKRAAHKDYRITFVFIANMIRYFNKWGWSLF